MLFGQSNNNISYIRQSNPCKNPFSFLQHKQCNIHPSAVSSRRLWIGSVSFTCKLETRFNCRILCEPAFVPGLSSNCLAKHLTGFQCLPLKKSWTCDCLKFYFVLIASPYVLCSLYPQSL